MICRLQRAADQLPGGLLLFPMAMAGAVLVWGLPPLSKPVQTLAMSLGGVLLVPALETMVLRALPQLLRLAEWLLGEREPRLPGAVQDQVGPCVEVATGHESGAVICRPPHEVGTRAARERSE